MGKQSLSKDTVLKIAKLANLVIKDDEIEKFRSQLSQILNYIGKLNELDTANILPTNQVTGLINVKRKDVTTGVTLSSKEALSNAPQTEKNMFKVPAIFEE